MSASDLIVELATRYAENEDLTLGDFLLGMQRIRYAVIEEEGLKHFESVSRWQSLVSELEAKIEELERANTASAFKTITVKTWRLFHAANEYKEDFIPFVKFVRGSGVVQRNDGEPVGLYEARYIAEFVSALYGYREFQQPVRGARLLPVINTHCTRHDVAFCIRLFLADCFDGWVIDVQDPYSPD